MAEVLNTIQGRDINRLLIHGKTAEMVVNTFREYDDTVLTKWSRFEISTSEIRRLLDTSASLLDWLMDQVEIDNNYTLNERKMAI